jgi:hypothetical protein
VSTTRRRDLRPIIGVLASWRFSRQSVLVEKVSHDGIDPLS